MRPDVTIYLEIGNECWAEGNACADYAEQRGLIENMTLKARQRYYSAELTSRTCYHIKTGQHYKNIFSEVFNSSANRIKLVFSSISVWTGPLETFYLCSGDYYKSFDMIGLAPYLSYQLTATDGSLLYTLDQVFNTVIDAAINDSVSYLSTMANIIKANAPYQELVTYEGGPDFSSLHDDRNVDLTNLSYYIHRDPRMEKALEYYILNISTNPNFTLKMYVHYTSAGPFSRYGCWGLIQASVTDLTISPKYKGYMKVIDSGRQCSWNEKPNECENNCNLKGVCSSKPLSSSRNTCECFMGYNGTSCQNFHYTIQSDCTYQCGGIGTCQFDHYDGVYEAWSCKCNKGYYGYGCGLFNCTGGTD